MTAKNPTGKNTEDSMYPASRGKRFRMQNPDAIVAHNRAIVEAGLTEFWEPRGYDARCLVDGAFNGAIANPGRGIGKQARSGELKRKVLAAVGSGWISTADAIRNLGFEPSRYAHRRFGYVLRGLAAKGLIQTRKDGAKSFWRREFNERS